MSYVFVMKYPSITMRLYMNNKAKTITGINSRSFERTSRARICRQKTRNITRESSLRITEIEELVLELNNILRVFYETTIITSDFLL